MGSTISTPVSFCLVSQFPIGTGLLLLDLVFPWAPRRSLIQEARSYEAVSLLILTAGSYQTFQSIFSASNFR